MANGQPLRCPPFELGESKIRRSGLRPLIPSGAHVSAGEAFAYCQVRVLRDNHISHHLDGSELRDCQLVFASRVSGRVHYGRTLGGWQHYFQTKPVDWDEPIAMIEPDAPLTTDRNARVMWIAGRRPTEVAEQLSGLMSGWHDRVRAWWSDGGPPTETVVAYGQCDLLGVIRGDRRAFLEMFRECRGPVHVADYSDVFVVPSSRVILSQLERTDEDCRAIAEDLMRGVAEIARGGAGRGVGSEALFLSAVLHQLTRPCPLLERHWVVGQGGARELPPARAVVLTGASELGTHLRHRRLGYVLSFPQYRVAEMTPATKGWFRETFEPLTRTVDVIEGDLRRLAQRLRDLTAAEIIVTNFVPNRTAMRDANAILMLNGLAADRTLRVIDVDALVADMGLTAHIADRAHADGELEREVRSQLLWTLRDMGMSGYGP